MGQHKGTIKRLVRNKGYGFLEDEQTREEFFFHMSGLRRGGKRYDELSEGMPAVWDREPAKPNAPGPRAYNVAVD